MGLISKARSKELKILILGTPTETLMLYLYVVLFPLSLIEISKTQGTYQSVQAIKSYFEEEHLSHIHTFE
jgi:hypothetical protein